MLSFANDFPQKEHMKSCSLLASVFLSAIMMFVVLAGFEGKMQTFISRDVTPVCKQLIYKHRHFQRYYDPHAYGSWSLADSIPNFGSKMARSQIDSFMMLTFTKLVWLFLYSSDLLNLIAMSDSSTHNSKNNCQVCLFT